MDARLKAGHDMRECVMSEPVPQRDPPADGGEDVAETSQLPPADPSSPSGEGGVRFLSPSYRRGGEWMQSD